MNEVILLKGGEFVLKGLNRHAFEDILMQNIRRRIKNLGNFSVKSAQSTIYVEPKDGGCDIDAAVEEVKKVFGIAAISRAAVCEKDMETIKNVALSYCKEAVICAPSFKVEAKRSDKLFPFGSPEIAAEVGGHLFDSIGNLKVDVKNPGVTVYVEIREKGAYIHAGKIPGAGGLPLSSSGNATLLLSGGIDSPVAGYMMAKRGLSLNAVHFHSFPYTSERSKEKVLKLAKIMCEYVGRMDVYVVGFTNIQTEIRKSCPEDYFTIIMRRFMMKIAGEIAKMTSSLALVTGESLAQVASQTAQAIAVTDESSPLPVLRPLIGMDKEEIVEIARKIDTFETSILPYEDCCTIFTPKHPVTKPQLEYVLDAMKALDEEALIKEAIESLEIIKVNKRQIKAQTKRIEGIL